MTHDITKSVRFFPNWRPEATEQVIGFLQMVNDIVSARGRVDRWVEVGSYFGESATMLLGFPAIRMVELVERSPSHADILRSKFRGGCVARRTTITEASSLAAAAAMPPASVDVVYIDADHSYEAVAADIRAWLPAVRPGGFIAGHDYHDGFPGVRQAVLELLGEPDRVYVDSTWMKEVR